jgi:PAS domain S-box-containing protein
MMTISRPSGNTAILSALLLTLLLIISIATNTLWTLKTSSEALENTMKFNAQKIQLVEDMGMRTKHRLRLLFLISAEHDPFQRDDYWLDFYQEGAEFGQSRDKLLTLDLSIYERELIEEKQSTDVRLLLEGIHQFEQLTHNDAMEEARQTLSFNIVPQQSRMWNHIEDFLQLQHKKILAAINLSTKNRQNALQRLTTSVALILAISLFLVMIMLHQQRTAAHLAESKEAHLRAIFNATPDGVMVIDAHNEIISLNPTAEKIFGYPPNTLLHRDLYQLIPVHYRRLQKKYMMALRHASTEELLQQPPIEVLGKHQKGHTFPLECSITEIHDHDDDQPAFVAVLRDITRRKQHETERDQLQKQVLESQKHQAIGQLAGGIAHEFNNMLQPILGMSSLLLKKTPIEAPSHKNLELIHGSAERAAKLVRQILDFSHRNFDEERLPVELSTLIKDIMVMLRSTLNSNIDLQTDLAPDTFLVKVDLTRMHQVILNLCNNAAQAMPDGGNLKIQLQNTSFKNHSNANTALPPGDYVQLSITDNGHGMDKEILSRIFEPFFTTKNVGCGTGMGLSVVQGIINSHHGEILVNSTPNEGSQFTVYLPAYIEQHPAVEKIVEPESVPTPEQTQYRLLFVDDEEMVRLTCSAILEAAGHQVDCCENAASALEKFRQNTNKFDAVITDFSMPGNNGMKLAEELHTLNPDLAIFICSGYKEVADKNSLLQAGVMEVITKPVNPGTLTNTLDKYLQKK